MEIISILVATFTAFILSWIYYSPKVFGNIWKKSLGLGEVKKSFPKFIQTFILLFFQFCIVAFFLNAFAINKLVGAYIIVFLLWYMMSSGEYIKSMQSGKNLKSFVIGTMENLLGLLIGATIIYIW